MSVQAQEEALSNGRNRRGRILLPERCFHEGPRGVAYKSKVLKLKAREIVFKDLPAALGRLRSSLLQQLMNQRLVGLSPFRSHLSQRRQEPRRQTDRNQLLRDPRGGSPDPTHSLQLFV